MAREELPMTTAYRRWFVKRRLRAGGTMKTGLWLQILLWLVILATMIAVITHLPPLGR